MKCDHGKCHLTWYQNFMVHDVNNPLISCIDTVHSPKCWSNIGTKPIRFCNGLQFRASRLLLRPVGGLLADFGAPLAIFIMSMVPIRFFPTIPLPTMPAATTLATTAGRPWLVPLFSIPPWAIFASAIPAVFVALLIFLDQVIHQ